eukprot:gene3243-3724_t
MVFAFNCFSTQKARSGYGSGVHEKQEKTFSSIVLEGTGNTNTSAFTSIHLDVILKKIGFKNCSLNVTVTNCQMCLGVKDLLQWNGHNESAVLNSTQFAELFSSILYLLTPMPRIGAVCNTSTARQRKNLTTDRSAFQAVLQQYGGGSALLTEENIDSILEDINKTLSYRLIKKPCFDVEDALSGSGVPETGADKNGFDHLSAFIILKLLKGHCISEHHHVKTTTSNLPKAKDFMDALLKEYAQNGTISSEKFKALLVKLGIGGVAVQNVTTPVDSHAGHDHRKRRSIDDADSNVKEENGGVRHRIRRNAQVSPSKLSGKCYSSGDLLKIHSVDDHVGINEAQFKNICPSLIQQIESAACKKNATKTATKSKEQGWKPWVSSVIAVLIISLGSLVGILVAPFSDGKNFTIVLTFLIAIAVSTLLGDALLHLFPHSLNLHKHEEGQAHISPLSKNSFIWKSLIFIAGVYMFYIFESIMHSMSKHEHSHGLQETHQHIGKGRSHSVVSGPVEIIHDKFDQHNKDGLIKTASGIHKCDETICIQMDDIGTKEKTPSEVYTNKKVVYQNANTKGDIKNGHSYEDHSHNHGHSHGHSHDVAAKKGNKLKSIVWMVLIGDSIHNFLDGIAIGVAFTDKFPVGFYGGISTSVAILCHELPHELGDFAILIQSGLSIKLALLLNFISSLVAVFGALIGVSLGQAMDASSWIFAITAGLFVYIAMVDMLPELIHSADLRHSPCKTMFFQHAGLLIGFSIMLCLAIFEEDIKV